MTSHSRFGNALLPMAAFCRAESSAPAERPMIREVGKLQEAAVNEIKP
jgi:hypothetical protein